MPVPSLPPEVWFRIAAMLPAQALSSLSKVDKALHEVATDCTHFLRLLSQTDVNIEQPSIRYRRLRALAYPTSHALVKSLSTPDIRIIGCAHDTLILLQYPPTRIILYPQGITVNLEGAFRSTGFRLSVLPTLRDEIASKTIILSDRCVAFIYRIRSPNTRFVVLNVDTGNLVEAKMFGIAQLFKHPHFPEVTYAVPAGNNAEWIMYFDARRSLILQDWRTGALVRKIDHYNDIKFVMGECPAINRSSVVGIAYQFTEGMGITFRAKGFDDVEETFRTSDEINLEGVVRSFDRKTHVFITSTGAMFAKKTSFYACRKGIVSTWFGRLPMHTSPGLRGNGSAISASTEDNSSPNRFDSDIGSKLLWVDLKDDGSIVGTSMKKIRKRSAPVWLQKGPDGLFAITRRLGKGRNIVDYMKFVNDGDESKEVCLKTWSLDSVILDLCVVADHFIVAKCEDGKFFIWHLDRFCKGVSGALSCRELLPENAV